MKQKIYCIFFYQGTRIHIFASKVFVPQQTKQKKINNMNLFSVISHSAFGELN